MTSNWLDSYIWGTEPQVNEEVEWKPILLKTEYVIKQGKGYDVNYVTIPCNIALPNYVVR
jgi:hypothetical protein